MAFDQTALCSLAVELESKESEAIGLDPVLTLALQAWLLEVYEFLLPRPSDYEQRETLVASFNKMAADSFGDNNGFPIVEAFGSFVMDIFTAESDLDLSINFSSDYNTSYSRKKKVFDLRRLLKLLYKLKKGHLLKIQPVLRARVPIIKVVDSGTGIECDVSAESKDGMTRTSTFKYVSLIDERFRILCFLMKAWAKAHDINCARYRTMNSLSIISLVAFHLQTRDPPIMPPFSALFKDGIDVSSVQKVVTGFEHFGRKNEDSIAQLFVTLLIKLLAVESLWEKGLCVSNYEGTWIKKEWGKGNSFMNVEDFMDRSQNFARNVGKYEIKTIYNCIKSSLQHLSFFMKGQMPKAVLKAHLFEYVPTNLSVNNNPKKKQRGHKKKKQRGRKTKRSNLLGKFLALNGITEKRALHTEAKSVALNGITEKRALHTEAKSVAPNGITKEGAPHTEAKSVAHDGITEDRPLHTEAKSVAPDGITEEGAPHTEATSVAPDGITGKRARHTEAKSVAPNGITEKRARHTEAKSVAPNGITEKRARHTEAIQEVRHDSRSVPTKSFHLSQTDLRSTPFHLRPSASFHLSQTDLPSAPFQLRPHFQLRPPAFPFQPSHRNPSPYQPAALPISQPGYPNQYQPSHRNPSPYQPAALPNSQPGYPNQYQPSHRNPSPYQPAVLPNSQPGYPNQYQPSHRNPSPYQPAALPISQPGYPNQYQPSHPNPSPYQPAALPISQPGYPNQYHPTLPGVPHFDYMSQYHPRRPPPPRSDYRAQYNFQPSTSRTSGFGPQYHPQVPFSPQLGHRIEQQPPVQSQFSSTHEYLPHQNSNLHSSREGFTWGLGQPQPPHVPPRQTYGPDSNNNLHPYH